MPLDHGHVKGLCRSHIHVWICPNPHRFIAPFMDCRHILSINFRVVSFGAFSFLGRLFVFVVIISYTNGLVVVTYKLAMYVPYADLREFAGSSLVQGAVLVKY